MGPSEFVIGRGHASSRFRTFENLPLSLITDAIYCLIGSEEVVPPPSGDDAVSETCLEHPDKSDTTVRPMAMQRQLIEKFVIYLCFVCIFDNLGEPHEYW